MSWPPRNGTPEGWELQFATNHLGHFALATGLHGALASADGARIVSVSSAAHLRSPVVFEDIHFHQRPYEPWSAYGQSKTANVLFAVAATRGGRPVLRGLQRGRAERTGHPARGGRVRAGPEAAARLWQVSEQALAG